MDLPENTGSTPRPNSKRGDPDWLTRTYYLEKATDIEVEAELIKLRRDGVEMDKSDLVNSVLKYWVAARRFKEQNGNLRTVQDQPIRSLACRWGIVQASAEARFSSWVEKPRKDFGAYCGLLLAALPDSVDEYLAEFALFENAPDFTNSLSVIIDEQSKLPEFGWEEFWSTNYETLTKRITGLEVYLEMPEDARTAPAIEPYIQNWLMDNLRDWLDLKLQLDRARVIRLALEQGLKVCTFYYTTDNSTTSLHMALDQELAQVQGDLADLISNFIPQ